MSCEPIPPEAQVISISTAPPGTIGILYNPIRARLGLDITGFRRAIVRTLDEHPDWARAAAAVAVDDWGDALRFALIGALVTDSDEASVQRRLAQRVAPGPELRMIGRSFCPQDEGIAIGACFGSVRIRELSGVRRQLNKILFEKRLARLGLKGDYATECIKWLGNE